MRARCGSLCAQLTMPRDSSKRSVTAPKKYEDQEVRGPIKKAAAKKSVAAVVLSKKATPTKKKPLLHTPTKRKRRIGNTQNRLGNVRGTPTPRTYKLVEERLREAGLWDQAVRLHNDLDLKEVNDLAFARRRERIRMHRNENGSIKTHPDGTPRESSPTPPTLALTPSPSHPLTQLLPPALQT